jgi:hypothetical protein
MAETKKITKREVINKMLQEEIVIANEDYKNYLENELRILDNKKNSNATSKTASENIELANTLYEVLKNEDKAMTISEILALDSVASIRVYNEETKEIDKPLSTSKVSYILNNDTRFVRTELKKKAYFNTK